MPHQGLFLCVWLINLLNGTCQWIFLSATYKRFFLSLSVCFVVFQPILLAVYPPASLVWRIQQCTQWEYWNKVCFVSHASDIFWLLSLCCIFWLFFAFVFNHKIESHLNDGHHFCPQGMKTTQKSWNLTIQAINYVFA